MRIFGSEIDNSIDTVTLPVAFDLRNSGRLSPVKTQPDGGCWASATMSSVESVFRTFGYGDYMLSDINLKLYHGFDSARSTNGNHYMATAYFSRGSGPVVKSSRADSLYRIAPETVAYISDARFLPDDPDLIKKVIMKFGAVYSMMHFVRSELDTITDTYYSGSDKINHAVNLVGWNDTLTVKNGRGVWIVQNSLGEKFGDSGFFYVPYSNPDILKYCAIWNKWLPYNPRAKIYYYDTLGSFRSYGYNDSLIYGLITFTAESDCRITKIGTSINHSDTRIYAEICRKFNKETGYLTEKQVAVSEKNCKFPGYYTLNLSKPVRLKKGEEFYILMRYIVPGASMPMPVEEYIEGYCNPVLTSGKCWINHDIEKWPDAWYETGKNAKYIFLRFNLCIKAYCVE